MKYNHVDKVQTVSAKQALKMSPDELVKGVKFRTQAEREFFEYTPMGSSELLYPHMTWEDNTPRHLRVERLLARLPALTGMDARNLSDSFRILDATPQIVDEFVKNARANPQKLDTYLQYMYNLAGHLAILEPAKGPLPAEALNVSMGEWNARGETYYEEYELPDPITATEVAIDFKARGKFELPDEATPYGEIDLEQAVFQASGPPEIQDLDDTRLSDQEVYEYHPVEKSEPRDWLQTQPLHYRHLIDIMRQCQSYSELKRFAYLRDWTLQKYLAAARKAGLQNGTVKQLAQLASGRRPLFIEVRDIATGELRIMLNPGLARYFAAWKEGGDEQLNKLINFYTETEAPFTSKAQADVFWSLYNKKKERLQAGLTYDDLRKGSQAQQLFDRIIESDKLAKLKFIGANLIRLQKGEFGKDKQGNSRNKVTNSQFSLLWKIYNHHKLALSQAA